MHNLIEVLGRLYGNKKFASSDVKEEIARKVNRPMEVEKKEVK